MKTKIEELTAKQESKLDSYFEKWTKSGLATKKLSKTKATKHVKAIYKAAGLSSDFTIEVHASPYAILKRGAELELTHEKKEMTAENMRSKMDNLRNSCCFGQHDVNWLGFYDFFRKEMGLKEETEELKHYIEASQYLHWFLPFENICLLSEFPTALRIEGEVLHCDRGPAVEYADGFCVYSLFGVSVPDWLACTPPKELDVNKVLSIANVDQRMVGLRKIGIENVRDQLKVQVLDTFGDYELWTIEVENRRIGPYLKMVCPSNREVFVEGVGAVGGIDATIKNCQAAIAHRYGLKEYYKPIFVA